MNTLTQSERPRSVWDAEECGESHVELYSRNNQLSLEILWLETLKSALRDAFA